MESAWSDIAQRAFMDKAARKHLSENGFQNDQIVVIEGVRYRMQNAISRGSKSTSRKPQQGPKK